MPPTNRIFYLVFCKNSVQTASLIKQSEFKAMLETCLELPGLKFFSKSVGPKLNNVIQVNKSAELRDVEYLGLMFDTGCSNMMTCVLMTAHHARKECSLGESCL